MPLASKTAHDSQDSNARPLFDQITAIWPLEVISDAAKKFVCQPDFSKY